MGIDYDKVYLKRLNEAQKEYMAAVKELAAAVPVLKIRIKTFINTIPVVHTVNLHVIKVTDYLIIGTNTENNITEAFQLVDFIAGFARIIGGGE
jgi:hypothetical protein